MSDKRWPGWVYGSGSDPDYRFSFANERTFLAWIRTSLALLAAGVALDVVDVSLGEGTQRFLATLLVGLGLVSAVLAWVRWAVAERAMRTGGPLPAFGIGLIFTLCVVIGTVVLVVAGL